jgi:micrococcal nuclease
VRGVLVVIAELSMALLNLIAVIFIVSSLPYRGLVRDHGDLVPLSSQSQSYSVSSCEVIDGDTVSVVIDLGFDIQVTQVVRINGVDAPEIETDAGVDVKHVVEEWVSRGVNVVCIDSGMYGGRFLGDLVREGDKLSTYLIRHGLAKNYNGENVIEWTNDELAEAELSATKILGP